MRKLTAKQATEVQRIAGMRDKDIDFSDIPEIRDWAGAVRGRFYRPIKEAVTIRIDADVLAWFRAKGDGYQTRVNQALRDYITHQGSADAPKTEVHEPAPSYGSRRTKRGR